MIPVSNAAEQSCSGSARSSIVVYRRSWHDIFRERLGTPAKKEKEQKKELFGTGRLVETAAGMEIDQGGLRQHFLDDFHTCLKKPRTKRFGFFTVTHKPNGRNQPRELGQATQISETSLKQNRGHYRRLLTDVNIFEHH